MAKPNKADASSPKQAVVVIHGMGQQKPMETLRSLVRVLWETDLRLTDPDPKSGARRTETSSAGSDAFQGPRPQVNKSWIVPDTRTGSRELARITTPAATNGLRTDFYEFYWADIMEGSTREQVAAWVGGLLLRWPYQVPKDVTVAWFVLWALTLLTVGLAINGAVSVFQSGVREYWIDPESMAGLWQTVVLAVVFIVVARNFLHLRARKSGGMTLFDWAFAFVVPVIIGAVVYWLVSPEVIASMAFGSFLMSGAIGVVLQKFVLPYFGDVALYVRAAPETVAKRALVRERGLDLLRALHAPVTRDDGNGADANDEHPPYQRIVIVAHSLGTIVAYDILRHFWAERGPVDGGIGDAASTRALEAVDAYIKQHTKGGELLESFDVVEYRKLQRAVSRSLARLPGGWLVTDFVTLGSPLTHAEFLLARDEEEFAALVRDGLVTTCPPTVDATEGSIVYTPQKAKRAVARHTAPFAAVRWTNICDTHRFVLIGDMISGLLRKTMGGGIADFDIKISKPGLLPRIFTHTSYWNADATSVVGQAGMHDDSYDVGPQPHIELLRDAVALNEPVLTEESPEDVRSVKVDAVPTA
ncbi:MAG: hypothetical protein AAFR13_00775 [Pseudomonadota bacterium]